MEAAHNALVDLGEPDPDTPAIFVVGFPKSGTTWVTALLVHALRLQYAPTMDVTATGPRPYNADAGIGAPTPVVIRHAHMLPEQLVEWHGRAPLGVVYVHRDVRDVLVSSFFFSYDHYLDRFLRRNNGPRLDMASPLAAMKSLRWALHARREFDRHVRMRCQGWNEYGGWTESINRWREYGDRGHKVVVAAYEDLLAGAEDELRRIIAGLEIDMPDDERLHRAVKVNAFKRQRARYEKEASESDDEQRRAYAASRLRFCRRGEAGDWRNYITRRLGRKIEALHGPMMRELGYSDSPDWWREL